MRKTDRIIKDVFSDMEIIYPCRGIALKEHRVSLGVSRKDFAKLCGWTIDFQIRLEVSRSRLSCFQRDRIVATFIVLCGKKIVKRGTNPS